MTLQSSGAISLLNIQNEFKGTDVLIKLLTDVSKLSPTVWTDNTPFTGRTPTTGTATASSQVTLTSSTIGTKTSYGSSTYSNSSNDNQPSEYSIPINEYYRGGLYVSDRDSSDALVNQTVPTNGEISLANFYDGINEDIILLIDSNRENLNLETAFNTALNGSWTNKRRKRLIINRLITIGGTYGNFAALTIPANLIGGLIIINYGDIVGYGGPQGQPGGTAILLGTSSPTTIIQQISKISHNLKSGIYGVIPRNLQGLSNRYLTPIGPDKNNSAATNSSIAHGTGEFLVGDSIYIYNIKTSRASDGDLIKHPNSNAEQLPNLCKIDAKETATFTAYISNGTLITAGNILSVISVAQPSVGMGIITGSTYKKHIITNTYRVSDTVTFAENKLLRASPNYFISGMAIFGTGVLEGTIVTGTNIFYPPPTSNINITKWGTITGTTFTLNQNPTEAILAGYSLGVNIGTNIYIVKNNNNGTYEVSAYVNADVYSYSYIIVNKSQTITGPVSVTGINHVLNADQSDGIIATNDSYDPSNTKEFELISTPTSMTAVRYTLDREVDISELTNKSSSFKFFTAGGTTSPGFTVTTIWSSALSALTEGQSVTISGTTATATGTNTTAINTLKFNGTWSNISKTSSSFEFFVPSTKIDNTYSAGSGTFPTSAVTPFTTPIKILNYGRIYGGGGGGSNSVGTRGQNMLRFFGSKFGSQTNQILGVDPVTGITSTCAAKVTLEMDAGFNGVGGNGQGYNQPKTLGTAGTPNPNAQRYAIIECFAGPGVYWTNTDPYLDLISIPENTKFRLIMNGSMGDVELRSGPVWKDVVFGQGTSLYDSTYTLDLTKYSYMLKIGNIYNFSTELVKIGVSNKINYIDKIYTKTTSTVSLTDIPNWKFYGTNTSNLVYSNTQKEYGYLKVGSTVPLGGTTNPHPQDRVRIITTKNKFTYDMNFASITANLALAAGDGGDFGFSGKSSASATIPAGSSGNYIQNSFIYSNVTWIETGDVKGRSS